MAFKEWAGVCEALAAGQQSIVLRKGGIAEGARGFVPEHPRFWLYPTHLHEGEQGLRLSPDPDRSRTSPRLDVVEIRTLVATGPIWWVDRLEVLDRLEPFHVWTEETVHKRFHYRKPGLWVLGVRVYRQDEPFAVPITAEHAGCKTWVPLDPPLETEAVLPTLDNQEFSRVMDDLRLVLNVDQ